MEDSQKRNSSPEFIEEVVIGTTNKATINIKVANKQCSALIDTGATKSCMSERFYKTLPSKTVKLEPKSIKIHSASGASLEPLGTAQVKIEVGGIQYKQEFIICSELKRSCILGLDFLRENRVEIGWTANGKLSLKTAHRVLVESIETPESEKQMRTITPINIPARSVITFKARILGKLGEESQYYESKPNPLLRDDNPELVMIPIIYNLKRHTRIMVVHFLMVNLGKEDISLPKGEVVGFLDEFNEEVNEIFTPEFTKTEILTEDTTNLERKFIISPADVNTHRRVELKDAEILEEDRQSFKKLCEEFDDIFSKDSTDIGRTPLLMMDIDTGDSSPICQRPYNLLLKHAEWVQKELEGLENAGLIMRSLSPWASPIVVVPKRTEPGEPPRRRLCVDYRMVNSLLPPVKKARSKAKGVISLVPLPKIDEIYGRLNGSKIYSTFDMRSGYYHLALTDEAQAKTAFVTGGPNGAKYEFKVCPFGLAQAPAYFQRLMNEVISEMPFAFVYLDDILLFSSSVKEHLKHMRKLFQQLRKAQLKLKESKCSFLKAHVQYLGHFISGEGIEPVPEKVQSIKEMPAPTTPKLVRQFLGLVGYYRKFIPRFSDIARPLTNLTKKEESFQWTKTCQAAYDMLRTALTEEPILKYPDTEKPYILYTDASKYAWACVLTQEFEHDFDGKKKKIHHPITYQSGLFKGSQLNWATLTKEAFAIYMSVKKLAYYLEDADITLRSDHLPLKKFLEQNTLNSKVNNWAVEISPFRIKFEYIKGIKNTLADTMSRLIKIIPDAEPDGEEPGYEFGYYSFEELEPIRAQERKAQEKSLNVTNQLEEISLKETKKSQPVQTVRKPDDDLDDPEPDLYSGLDFKVLRIMQSRDPFCSKIIKHLEKGQIKEHKPYYMEEGSLMKWVEDKMMRYPVIVIPERLTPLVLRLAHDELGHNGSTRTYMYVKRVYYWKGMKHQILKYVKNCFKCRKVVKTVAKYEKLHYDVPTSPMRFISMDLIGEFHPPSTRGNRYALTVICMHTGYVFCVPLQTKTASEVVRAYIDNVYAKFGASEKIMSDNGTEFKNALFEQIAEELGIKRIFTPPYHPQSNGRIEGFHRFLKACIAKHISKTLEWDEVVPLACAAYNFFPGEHSTQSPFWLMFGREARTPLTTLIQPRVKYLGNDENIISLEALKNMYQMVAQNIKKAREKMGPELNVVKANLKEGDSVMIRDFTKGPFEPTYKGNYRVVKIKGQQVELMPATGGKTFFQHISNVKYILPVDRIISQIPDYEAFGRKPRLRLNPDHVPDLGLKLATSINTMPVTTVTMATKTIVSASS